MRYSIERVNEATAIVEADGFEAMSVGGGMLSGGPTSVHYIFWLKPSGQYMPRTNIAAFSDVRAVRQAPAVEAATSATDPTEAEPVSVN
jgi:hypothetical protein